MSFKASDFSSNSNTFLVPMGVRLSTIFAVIAEGHRRLSIGPRHR